MTAEEESVAQAELMAAYNLLAARTQRLQTELDTERKRKEPDGVYLVFTTFGEDATWRLAGVHPEGKREAAERQRNQLATAACPSRLTFYPFTK